MCESGYVRYIIVSVETIGTKVLANFSLQSIHFNIITSNVSVLREITNTLKMVTHLEILGVSTCNRRARASWSR